MGPRNRPGQSLNAILGDDPTLPQKDVPMTAPDERVPPPTGRIDVHSHVLPGIDDGCQSAAESIASVRRLIESGYVGSICTPHCWPQMFPQNTPRNIERWVADLRQALSDHGLTYRLWTGGELRLFEGVVEWMKREGVPTLADSNCVLCDFWERKWTRWVDHALDWLMSEGYQPILAHPERLSIPKGLPAKIDEWTNRGLLLQGNFRCLTGEDGRLADRQIRQWLGERRYHLLALDMHRPDTLEARLAGIGYVEREHGADVVEEAIVAAPRRLIFAGSR